MDGKVVMITGASRGIGAAAARAFVKAGAKVALLARSREAIVDLAGELGKDHALAIPCDVSRYWEMDAAVAATRDTLGDPDVLINNAGVIEPIARLDEVDVEGWQQVIDVNVKGVFNGMRAVIPGMRSAGRGTIITISSGAASNALEGWSAYCTSKAAAAMLTRAADLENRDAGLRIMGLSPGTVATEMQRDIKASGINRVSELDWSDHIPPEWPAQALVWMAGPAGNDLVGTEVSLRDEEVRRKVGLVE